MAFVKSVSNSGRDLVFPLFKPKLSNTFVDDDRTTLLETWWCPNRFPLCWPAGKRTGGTVQAKQAQG